MNIKIAWNKGLKGVSGRKRILPNYVCKFCNIEFRPKYSKSKFCSKKCAIKMIPLKGVLVKCSTCKEEIYRRQSTIKGDRHKNGKLFCSRICQSKYDYGGKVERKCLVCNNLYKTYKSQINRRCESKYCSRKCQFEYRRKNYIAKKRDKKTKNSVLKKELWLYFSRYIRQRDDGTCISCGKKDFWRKMDAGHYIPKTAGLSLYFDERNVNCQCTYCNRWMHGNLSRYAIALRKKYGESILEELDRERVKIKRFSSKEYISLIEKYKSMV